MQLSLDLDPFEMWEDGPHLVWRCPGCAVECCANMKLESKQAARAVAMNDPRCFGCWVKEQGGKHV